MPGKCWTKPSFPYYVSFLGVMIWRKLSNLQHLAVDGTGTILTLNSVLHSIIDLGRSVLNCISSCTFVENSALIKR